MNIIHWLRLMVLLMLSIGLGYAILLLPEPVESLPGRIVEQLPASGVANPVTAVLLNFRGYDTLLEVTVLLVALLGVWSIEGIADRFEPPAGSVLSTLTHLLLPLLILVAGYLLWKGAGDPGGAFQAGAVLAAAGVLLILSGWRLKQRHAGLLLRIVVILGLAIFVITAIVLGLIGGTLLQFPPAWAGRLILIIEFAATLSIGATLAALFFGSRPDVGAE